MANVSSKINNYNNPGYENATKLKATLLVNNKEYNLYKLANGSYAYGDGVSDPLVISNANAISAIERSANKSVGIDYNIAQKANTTTTKSTSAPTTKVSSGGRGSKSSGVSSSYYDAELAKLKEQINTLENPKVYSAAELASMHGITDQYDYNKILDMYNTATNDYYNAATTEEQNIANDANLSNASYASNIIRDYLKSYNNAAPTAVGKGTLAANTLSTLFNTDATAEAAATGFNNIIKSYDEAKVSELANNPVNARTDYNSLGSWLLSQGASLNATDVQNYVNSLNAINEAYSGIRNSQNNLASTAASTYQANANAALAKAATNSNLADVKYYQAMYGDKWYTAYANAKANTETKYNTTKS